MKNDKNKKDKFDKIDFLKLSDLEKKMMKMAMDSRFDKIENIKWVVTKALGVPYKDYDNIKNLYRKEVDDICLLFGNYIKGEYLSDLFTSNTFCGQKFENDVDSYNIDSPSETLIDAVSESVPRHVSDLRILDVCTGNGCLAITLSQMFGVQVDAADISPFSLDIAKKNAKRLGGDIRPVTLDVNGNWGESEIEPPYDVIVSSPPRNNNQRLLKQDKNASDFEIVQEELGRIEEIIKNAKRILTRNGYLFLEISPELSRFVVKLFEKYEFTDISISQDGYGQDRVVYAKRGDPIENSGAPGVEYESFGPYGQGLQRTRYYSRYRTLEDEDEDLSH